MRHIGSADPIRSALVPGIGRRSEEHERPVAIFFLVIDQRLHRVVRPLARGIFFAVGHDHGDDLVHLRMVRVDLAHGDSNRIVQGGVAAGLVRLLVELANLGQGDGDIAVSHLGIEQGERKQVFDFVLLGESVQIGVEALDHIFQLARHGARFIENHVYENALL